MTPSAETVARAQAGDETAFALLYHAHAPRLYATCLRLAGGDADGASDALQDAFVRAWEALPGWRGDSAIGTWLHRIAVNTSLERLRRDARREGRGYPTDGIEVIESAAAPEPLDERLDLERAMTHLPAPARIVFVLRAIEGYSYAEIHHLTGTSEVALRAQMVRTRRQLASYLDP